MTNPSSNTRSQGICLVNLIRLLLERVLTDPRFCCAARLHTSAQRFD